MSSIEVDIHSVREWMSQGTDAEGTPVVVIDCRETSEYAIAKIDGAQLLPMSTFPLSPDALTAYQGKHIVVHCHHGGRSLRVANWFRQNGFADAQSMAGGIDAWSVEIDPTIPRY